MATYAVLLEDDIERGAGIRREHMPAHLAFLERNAAAIRCAGPLHDAAGGPAGGLWLVEAGSFAEVEALMRQDPFWSAGLRRSVRIAAWQQVFAEGRRV